MAASVIIVTVSDTRTEADDTSGKALMEELCAFDVGRKVIVKDDPEQITAVIKEVMEKNEADAIVFTGGTGIAPRDRTYEAVATLFDKELEGFGEAFRRLSWDEIGPRSILSRATAGTIGTHVMFLVPGSEKAARLAAKAIIAPMLQHAVDLLQGKTKHHGAK